MNASERDAALRRLHEAMGLDQQELCNAIVDRYVKEVDAYAAEDRAHGRERILANVRVQLESMRSSLTLPPGVDFEVPTLAIAVAQGRAADGFPLEAVMQAYHIATQCVWDWMNRSDRLKEDHQTHIEAGWPKWLIYVDRAMRVAANAYVAAARERARMDAASRRHFLAMLLSGQLEGADLHRWLAVVGHADARGHVLVALGWHEEDELLISELSDRIAMRVLSQVTRGPTPGDFQPVATVLNHHSALLIPTKGRAPSVVRTAVMDALGADVPSDVPVVGAISETLNDLSQAASVFRLLTRVTSMAARDRTVVALANMTWFDHAIAGVRDTFNWYQPSGTSRLVKLLREPANESWTPTLEAWFTSSLNVKHAAELLHVHPNTVYYRLSQIERVSGIDPRDAGGLVELLMVSRLVRGQADPR